MSSFLLYASPIDSESSDDSYINNKRNFHNKTQRHSSNNSKVNSVLQSIHETQEKEDESTLGNFVSVSSKKNNSNKEGYVNYTPSQNIYDNGVNQRMYNNKNMPPAGADKFENYYPYETTDGENLDMNRIAENHRPSKTEKKYGGYSDNITDKMNYIIHLLEEQQSQKTDNVTEEIILYSFLGIFMIFLVDGFVRVGRYSR